METNKYDILKTITTLYVEDEEEIQQQLSFFLKKRLKNIYTALDGQEGIEKYIKYKPDIIITDVRMPTMDGLRMAETIRNLEQDIPIIVTTAFDEQDYFMRSIDIGIDKYVLKPIDPYVLLDAVAKSAIVLVQKREAESNHRYIRFILDSSPDFLITTSSYEIEYINKTFLNFLGYSSIEDFGDDKRKLEDFFLKIEGKPYTYRAKKDWIQYVINNPKKDVLVYFNNRQDPGGDPKIYLVKCSKFSEFDKYVFSFTNITNIENEKKELERQVINDILAGMFNSKKMIDTINIEINRSLRYKTPLSVILFSIDRFKEISNMYGHYAGNCMLQDIIRMVSESIRESDTFVRWGEEDFLILASETDKDHAKTLAEKIGLIIKEFLSQEVGNVSSSYGVAQFRQDDDMESFINRVDRELSEAKEKQARQELSISA